VNPRMIVPVLLLVSGCVTVYKGPATNHAASVQVSVEGLMTHVMYPNDFVWLDLYRTGTENHWAPIKLTTDNPQRQIFLDVGASYTLRLTSWEQSFGLNTHCVAETRLSPQDGEKYTLSYYTRRSACTLATQVQRVGARQYEMLATDAGRVSGERYTACVRGPGCP
jgi:hypothetical protein